MLSTLSSWVSLFPPLQQPMRYGNRAFRQWHQKVGSAVEGLVRDLLQPFYEDSSPPPPTSSSSSSSSSSSTPLAPLSLDDAVSDLTPYLSDSFGNGTRIDYGTGHETNFAIFLLLLRKLGPLAGPKNLQGIGLTIFPAYLKLARALQTAYFLEPAGSHGAWSLDDYHLLPFVWGSSQLVGQDYVQPKEIHDAGVVSMWKGEYMYLDAVAFVTSVKHGATLAEHSPLLNDISQIKSWTKTSSGMLKMFHGEVLTKFPVIQHVVFGLSFPSCWVPSLPPPIPLGYTPTPAADDAEAHDHSDAASSCCPHAPWAVGRMGPPLPADKLKVAMERVVCMPCAEDWGKARGTKGGGGDGGKEETKRELTQRGGLEEGKDGEGAKLG